jgi:hypothetical protein
MLDFMLYSDKVVYDDSDLDVVGTIEIHRRAPLDILRECLRRNLRDVLNESVGKLHLREDSVYGTALLMCFVLSWPLDFYVTYFLLKVMHL